MNLYDLQDFDFDLVKGNQHHILVIPNITRQRELEKDSFVLVMMNVIRELNLKRDDLYFTIPMPKFCEQLDFPNVNQPLFDQPTFPNSMRSHYDFIGFWKDVLNTLNVEYDVVWSHLPEQTVNVVNNLQNLYSSDIPVIGYSHWIENKENNPNNKHTFYHYNVAGMLTMDKCGFNTKTQIEELLSELEEHYSEKTMEKLEDIMTPVYLGFEDNKIIDRPVEQVEKRIVFNHRTHAYRGYDKFLQIIKRLRNKRQDFKVWFTMADQTTKLSKHFDDTSFFELGGEPSREDYLQKLRTCVAGYHGGNRWAMSSQDGLGQGVVYVYDVGNETKEIFGELETGFRDIDTAVEHFDRLLDDNQYRLEQSQVALEHCRQVHSWRNRVSGFEKLIQDALDSNSQVMSHTDARDKIEEFIKEKKKVSIREIRDYMGWGKSITFRKYRNYIKSLPDFHVLHHGKEEYYVFKELHR